MAQSLLVVFRGRWSGKIMNTSCPCGGEYIGVEYRGTPEDYDGISEWRCEQCGKRVGRWTGKELKEDELEPRFGIQRRTQAT